ncbi:hypothetical protein QEJ31_00470 [Pigmentibacter sp. JX0631]|uniref:hypothetical protein n=1 Tax=Pigmentibacter sp. JX0631 TaxID=2976982 RepID=UPI002469C2BE|nr:hypothetical protein [Pigmentibacter sp. JX0631]WGL60076.1 hypothetical protein QEJ31_00470 [Pigmentibacter sp. JX0631]
MLDKQKYSEIIFKLLEINPHFKRIIDSKNLKYYYEPACNWKPDSKNFPYKENLKSRIIDNIKKVYDIETAYLVKKYFDSNFCAETGSHISIPRSQDKVGKNISVNRNINTLIFQGTILSAAKNINNENKIHFSMGTSRVYLNNANSAAYIQFDKDDGCVRLVSNRWKDTPQIYIPSFELSGILNLKMQATNFIRKKYANKVDELQNGIKNIEKIFAFFEEVSTKENAENKNNLTFSEQISKVNSFLFNEILSQTGLKHVSIDYEKISWDFLIELLEDKKSITYKIFSDKKLRDKFLNIFSEIQTGWQSGQLPFDEVIEKNGIKKLFPLIASEIENSESDLFIEKILENLRENRIIPKGVLQFFLFMIEGGLLPLGGMNQSIYCTKIRDLSIHFLQNDLGEHERAAALKKLPSEIMNISLSWGIMKGTNDLLCYSDFLEKEIKLNKSHMHSILNIPGEDALNLSIPSLCEFLLQENFDPLFENQFIQQIKEKGNILQL